MTVLFNVVGMIGAYLVGVVVLNIQEGPFLHKFYHYVDVDDVIGGLIKAAIFGVGISLISCFMGYTAENGAAGVGRATTRAVVVSSVTVLVVDYFLTSWILHFIVNGGDV